MSDHTSNFGRYGIYWTMLWIGFAVHLRHPLNIDNGGRCFWCSSPSETT